MNYVGFDLIPREPSYKTDIISNQYKHGLSGVCCIFMKFMQSFITCAILQV
jgi:hypothetical protein